MRIDIITLFPEMFEPVLNGSIIGRAQKSGVLEIVCHQLRDYAFDKHKRVDDTPSRDRSHGTQSNATKAEDGAVFQSDFGQWNEQYQRLECHAQRPRACGQGDFVGGPKIKRMLGGTAE